MGRERIYLTCYIYNRSTRYLPKIRGSGEHSLNGEMKMKILITILLAFFLSSTANANSIKNVCEYQEEEILITYGLIDSYINMRLKAFKDQDRAKIKEVNNILDNAKTMLREKSKTYHYLDCSDFRR